MPTPTGANQTISCQECRDLLPEYVRQELAHQPVEMLYPVVADHLQTCLDCEEAYDLEFHRQGMLLSLPQAQALGNRAAVAHGMAEMMQGVQPVPVTWVETLWEYGRSWRDELTGGWRQLELMLSHLRGPQTNAPALAGRLHAARDPEGDTSGASLHAAPESAQFELRVLWRRQAQSGEHCLLEVVITLYDRFGDYSGVEVLLQTEDRVHVATTNALGKVEFGELTCADLGSMRLLIRMPEEQDESAADASR
jgi:hypothetical protein